MSWEEAGHLKTIIRLLIKLFLVILIECTLLVPIASRSLGSFLKISLEMHQRKQIGKSSSTLFTLTTRSSNGTASKDSPLLVQRFFILQLPNCITNLLGARSSKDCKLLFIRRSRLNSGQTKAIIRLSDQAARRMIILWLTLISLTSARTKILGLGSNFRCRFFQQEEEHLTIPTSQILSRIPMPNHSS